MSLLNTKTGYTTPWHCSVALMADGEWLSGTMGDLKKDPKLEIVYEDGRPSYFREKRCDLNASIDSEKSANSRRGSNQLKGHSEGIVADIEAAVEKSMDIGEEKFQHQPSTLPSSYLDGSEEAKITELVRTLSYNVVRNEKGELINPFFGSEHPLLDPNSGKFSPRAWLETVMSITSKDPERYPKGIAGVAYKNLSAHGFGEPTDYQKTFGNCLLKPLDLVKRLIGKGKKTRIQILRGFDGLVKSGEMLVVLGRPGRQVIY